MGFVNEGQPITTEEAKALIREDLTRDQAFEEFIGLVRELVAAVSRDVAEIDVEREVEGEETIHITIRREPFRAS